MIFRSLPLLAVLLIPQSTGQQATTPQPTTTQPCTPQALPKPLKDIHPPSRFQQMLDKQRQRIQQQTGLSVPSIDDLKKDAQQPCPAPDKQAVPKTITPPPPPVPVTPPKPVYVCPPKATLIPGYPYCLLPDHSTVDAIPLPPAAQQPKQ